MNLNEYFEKKTGLGVLATADRDGRVNAAVYARPHVMEDGSIAFIMPDRLTHDNLQSNGDAAYLFRECSAALAGGYCLTRPAKDLGLDGGCRLHQKSQCIEWVADKEIIDRLLQTGALVLLPGWLADWESHIEAGWPGDPKAAQAYFREVAKRAVLLDTGVHPGIDRELKAFTRFLRRSGEVHPAGLDLFRLNLARVALSWRVERRRKIRRTACQSSAKAPPASRGSASSSER